MRKFELGFGYLGNGCTVWNRARKVNGDYEWVAHISDAGNIHWYVKPGDIPGDALLRIEHQAHAMESNFMNQFNSLPETKQYEFLLDRAKHADLMKVCDMKDATMWEKICFLRSVVIPTL